GLLMTGFGAYFIAEGYAAESWTEVEGQIVSARVRVHTDLSSSKHLSRAERERYRRYYPEITYRWTAGEERYTGSRYRLGETHEKYKERTDAEAKAATFVTGAPITVYYDKDHPDQAVLDPSLSVGVFVPLPLGLLILGMGWLLFRYRDALEKAMNASTQAPAAATTGRSS
ncbi:MAG: DUF3592 domain-containing protein, partial [Acidobacteria bacterium]|nr:DUF3592 domain-containing protein [Acidobacteriota bacterium]